MRNIHDKAVSGFPYESPSAVVLHLDCEGILCDSTPGSSHGSFEEEHDWGFGW